RIPRVEFTEASVAEALEFVRRKSIEHDTEDRQDRGINIILDQAKDVAGSHVTLALADITVLNALQTIASISGLELQVTDVAVILKPGAEPSAPSGKNGDGKPATTKFGSRGQLPKPGAVHGRPGAAIEVPPTPSSAK